MTIKNDGNGNIILSKALAWTMVASLIGGTFTVTLLGSQAVYRSTDATLSRIEDKVDDVVMSQGLMMITQAELKANQNNIKVRVDNLEKKIDEQ